ncbi:MAG TPA: DUF4384 domain-containing protein [Pyrinomonadaceae bacterium]|nr:DUF4384 domain-containing protein [Pyrinomonadaceae bacterium]
MILRATVFVLTLALLGFLNSPASFAQGQEEDVRGAFMTTRPKTAEKTAANPTSRPIRRRPKPVATPNPTPDSVPAKPPEKAIDKKRPKVRTQRLGLGMTLFTRDSHGLAVRIDPAHEFRRGDLVRLLLETNANGYVYVFNTTDGGQPVLIYPDPQLDEGGNYIQAHVPFELPSSVATEERLRWLAFDEHAGAEKVYVVFTREPLDGLPIEDALITFCKEKASNCPLQPGADLWAAVQKELNAPVTVAKTKRFGKPQTSGEQQATTRGIGLSKQDPEPSLIMMTTTTNPAMLVATLDLIHK